VKFIEFPSNSFLRRNFTFGRSYRILHPVCWKNMLSNMAVHANCGSNYIKVAVYSTEGKFISITVILHWKTNTGQKYYILNNHSCLPHATCFSLILDFIGVSNKLINCVYIFFYQMINFNKTADIEGTNKCYTLEKNVFSLYIYFFCLSLCIFIFSVFLSVYLHFVFIENKTSHGLKFFLLYMR